MDEKEWRKARMTDLLRTIDAAVGDRVLVYGSLPPAGRDLDLLVRPEEESRLAASLRDGGFRPWGREWVRFEGCSALVVELIPAASLRPGLADLADLFAHGTPLPGSARVVEPAPHHALLILAGRLSHAMHLQPKHRKRIDRELERDPKAWQRAEEAAKEWKVESALERLSDLYSGAHRRHFNWRSVFRKPRRNRVVVVSSVDPARRRLHADALRDTLDRLGISAVAENPCPTASLGLMPGQETFGPLRATLIATKAALRLWLPVLRRIGRGKVLIYETSAVDVAAALSGLSPRVLLPLRLTPSALCAFLLEDHPEPARTHAWTPTRFTLRRVPASIDPDDACVEIAQTVLDALSS